MVTPHVTTSTWTFLTNHSHVLLCLAKSPSMRMREIAEKVGITERAVQRIIADLRNGGYLHRNRSGRCNTYQIKYDKHLRHPIEEHRTISDLVSLLFGQEIQSSGRHTGPADETRQTEVPPTIS